MPDKRRNFWILLTIIAIVFAGTKWLESKQRTKCSISVAPTAAHSYNVKKKCRKKRERKRRHCHSSYTSTPSIDQFIHVQQEPIPTNIDLIRRKIGYPQIAKDAGIEGSVIIRVLVDERGNYQAHKVISQSHPFLGKNCERHIADLTFSPAIKNHRPIKYWVNIPFGFYVKE